MTVVHGRPCLPRDRHRRLEGAAPPVEAIATAIEEAVGQPPAEHALDLYGVAVTQRILEDLVPGADPISHR